MEEKVKEIEKLLKTITNEKLLDYILNFIVSMIGKYS